MFSQSELTAAANAFTLSEQDIQTFLAQAYENGLVHGHNREPATYWQAGDLDELNAALKWWPKSFTIQYVPPQLGSMLGTYWQPMNNGQTFRGQLYAMAERCAAWLKAEGKNVVNPNETKEERQRRITRERVTRWRDARKQDAALDGAPGGTNDDARSAAVATIDAEIADLRLRMAAELDPLRAATSELYQQMLVKSQERKVCEAKWTTLLQDAKDRRVMAWQATPKEPSG